MSERKSLLKSRREGEVRQTSIQKLRREDQWWVGKNREIMLISWKKKDSWGMWRWFRQWGNEVHVRDGEKKGELGARKRTIREQGGGKKVERKNERKEGAYFLLGRKASGSQKFKGGVRGRGGHRWGDTAERGGK